MWKGVWCVVNLLTKKSSSASQVLTDVDSTTSSCKFASKLADIDVSLSGVKVDKLGSDSSHVSEEFMGNAERNI